MSRVVRFHETGGPEVLRIEQVEVPPPGKCEVQIGVKAIGLNRAESMFRSGQYLEAPKLPAGLGYEAAGTVTAIGPGVRGFEIGDAASTIPAFSLNDYGTCNRSGGGPARSSAAYEATVRSNVHRRAHGHRRRGGAHTWAVGAADDGRRSRSAKVRTRRLFELSSFRAPHHPLCRT